MPEIILRVGVWDGAVDPPSAMIGSLWERVIDTPFPPGSFDTIQLWDDENAWSEVQGRRLMPDGRRLRIDLTRIYLNSGDLKPFLDGYRQFVPLPWAGGELAQLMRAAGWEIVPQ
ncbi:hypothetical protein ABH935_006989 [Catenulispora sp. GAS73]|uniref:hypothetical protein n=1 Tax=Catenulispora sp. GAS73 TaxID=3156269 RepID=UPI0035149EDA